MPTIIPRERMSLGPQPSSSACWQRESSFFCWPRSSARAMFSNTSADSCAEAAACTTSAFAAPISRFGTAGSGVTGMCSPALYSFTA